MTTILTILSMILALLQVGKEVVPVVKPMMMEKKPALTYRGNDGQYAYYCDSTGRYWSRVDRYGAVQYTQNPIY